MFALLFMSLLSILAWLLYSWLNNLYSYWQRMGVPHEKPELFFGNMKGVGSKLHFGDVNRRLYRRFKGAGPFVGMWAFLRKSALILDLDLIKHVLIKDFDKFHDRGIFNNVRDDPLTGHLFALEGEQWRALRHKLSPVFTSGKMRFMQPSVVRVAEQLEKTVGQMLGVFDVKDICARYTADVIGTCIFGIECNSLKDPHAEFIRHGRNVIEKPRHKGLMLAFIFTNPKLARKLRMKFVSEDVSQFFLSAVRSTVQLRVQNNVKRNDFMDMLIELMDEEQRQNLSSKHRDNLDFSQGLTLEQITAQALVFFLAGFDTSSTTMSLMLYELALQPEIQQRLRLEIAEVLRKHKGELSYESMHEMHYLDQVMAETLRKYPLLPHIVREAAVDYAVPNSKFVLEKGTNVLIPIIELHNDPEYYPNPEKFDPERFSLEAVKHRNPSTYLPFGDGPRNCIGLRFGKMQSKIGIISLLRSYKFSRCESTPVPMEFNKRIFLTNPLNGVPLKVERLES